MPVFPLKLLVQQQGGADFIIRASYQDGKPSIWLSERSGIPMLALPMTVGGNDQSGDLFSYFDNILDQLLGASH